MSLQMYRMPFNRAAQPEESDIGVFPLSGIKGKQAPAWLRGNPSLIDKSPLYRKDTRVPIRGGRCGNIFSSAGRPLRKVRGF